MGKIKVMHIGMSLSGIDTYIRYITAFINPQKFETVVVNGKNEINEKFKDNDDNTIKNYELNLVRHFSLIKDIVAIFKICRIIIKEKPNLIHAHSSKGGLIGRIAAFIMRVPVVYTPNAFSYLSAESNAKYKFFLWYERIFKYITTFFLACSDSELKRATNEIKYKSERCRVWLNSIPPKKEGNNKPENYLITIGRPSYQKNTDKLIEIFNKLNNVLSNQFKLKIVGVGHYSPLKNEVENLISKYNLHEQIELVHWLPRGDTIKLLSSAYCFISTSRYEGLSFANLEALALGIPIIASNVDGNRDCTIQGKTGFLIDNEVNLFVEKIIKLIKEPQLRNEMSAESLRYFNHRFNIENTIEKLENIYIEVSNKMLKV